MSVDNCRPRSMAELSDALCELSIAEMACLLRDVIERRAVEEPGALTGDYRFVGFVADANTEIPGSVRSISSDGGDYDIFVYTPRTGKEAKANER